MPALLKWVEYGSAGGCFALTTRMEGVSPSAEAGGKIAFEVDDMDTMVDTFRKRAFR